MAASRSLIPPRASLPAQVRGAEDLAAAFLLGPSAATVAAYRRDLADFGESSPT